MSDWTAERASQWIGYGNLPKDVGTMNDERLEKIAATEMLKLIPNDRIPAALHVMN